MDSRTRCPRLTANESTAGQTSRRELQISGLNLSCKSRAPTWSEFPKQGEDVSGALNRRKKNQLALRPSKFLSTAKEPISVIKKSRGKLPSFMQSREDHLPETTKNLSLQVLTRNQARTLEAMADRILPATDTPGAVEAEALKYIDRALVGDYVAFLSLYRRGLRAIDHHRQKKFGAKFFRAKRESARHGLTGV